MTKTIARAAIAFVTLLFVNTVAVSQKVAFDGANPTPACLPGDNSPECKPKLTSGFQK